LLDLCLLAKQLLAKDTIQVILRQFCLKLTEEQYVHGWFQQGSTTINTARTSMSMQAASDVLGDRNLSSDTWPVNSPNPGPYDLFLQELFEGQTLHH
jgi:hypothetical protein